MRLAYIFVTVALIATPALAETAIIPTKNLDMSDKSQVAKLHQAVVKTAEAVCKKDGMDGRDLKDCIKLTTDAAIKGNPSMELKAFHASLASTVRYALAN